DGLARRRDRLARAPSGRRGVPIGRGRRHRRARRRHRPDAGCARPASALRAPRGCATMAAPGPDGPASPAHEHSMPLSEDEQRILREIEANLSVTDPKLVQQVSDTTLYRHAARMIKWSVLGFVVGLTITVTTFTSVLPLAVGGFLLMLFC